MHLVSFSFTEVRKREEYGSCQHRAAPLPRPARKARGVSTIAADQQDKGQPREKDRSCINRIMRRVRDPQGARGEPLLQDEQVAPS